VIALDQVKKHLRVLHANEDDLIDVYINAAECRFEQFTGRKLYEDQAALDADTTPPTYTAVMNDEIKSGCLLLIGHLYANRSEDAAMPRAIECLWQGYRVIMIG